MDIARLYTDRALRLIRLGNGQVDDIRRDLRVLAGELRGLLAADVSGMGRRELSALLRDIDAVIAGRYEAIADKQMAAMADLMTVEAAWAQRASRLGRPASKSVMGRLAAGLSVFGTLLRDAWASAGAGLSMRAAGVIREAAAGQAPADNVVTLILGAGPPGKETGGLIQTAARNADALVHTTVSEAATDARMATWKANGVNAFRWHAVLDSRTTAGCALRHGLLYELDTLEPIRHDVPIERAPPRHYRCRSILLPMAYADDIPAPEDGGQSTFADYFESLSPAQQDDLFGAGRADLFRRGVITQADLVNQAGQMLTLADLQKLTVP